MLDRLNVIFDRSNLIFDQSKIVQRFFLKNIRFSRVVSLFKLFKSYFSLSSIGQDSKQDFLSFSLKFLQGFLSSKVGKTFLPFIFHLFSCFMHFFHAFWG